MPARLRIAMVTPQWVRTKGGPSTYVGHLTEALRRRGHEVTVLAGEEGPGAIAFDPRPGRREAGILRALRAGKPDVVHLHGRVHYIPPAWAYRAAAGKKVRLVFTFHTQPFIRVFLDLGDQPQPDYAGVKRLLARFLLPRCDAVTSVSRNLVENLNRGYGLGIDTFTVIQSAAAPAAADPARLAALKYAYGLHEAFPVLSSIGVLTWDWKVAGHLICCQAAALLRDRFPRLKLLIAGDGRHRGYLEAKIRSLGLEQQAVLLGNWDQIPELLAATDMYVHLALNEGCPLAVIEAMQAGKPIIAARRGGIPEIIADGDTGRLIEPEAEALARTVAELLGHQDERRRLGMNAQAHWRRRLRWEVIAAQYEAVYGQARI
jgi:glycosyltransferase involved in cell wall biosynthesis